MHAAERQLDQARRTVAECALPSAGPRADAGQSGPGILQAGCGTQTVWIERPSERARRRAARREIKKTDRRSQLADRHLRLARPVHSI